jgi:hypothetical protein
MNIEQVEKHLFQLPKSGYENALEVCALLKKREPEIGAKLGNARKAREDVKAGALLWLLGDEGEMDRISTEALRRLQEPAKKVDATKGTCTSMTSEKIHTKSVQRKGEGCQITVPCAISDSRRSCQALRPCSNKG